MSDAVTRLRELTNIPICLEEVEYDLQKDSLTLAAAIQRLTRLRAKGPLSEHDQISWNAYQQESKRQDPNKSVVGVDKHVFRIPKQSDVTLQAVFDLRVSKHPLVIIQPRTSSVLD
jgi:hypothetical protein